MDRTHDIGRMIEPAAAALGYELVRVQLTGGQRLTLQVMAERLDRRSMNVDDCALLSRRISALLDEADPIAEAYTLEVSSPGIDRPLMKPADFTRFVGHDARVEVDPPVAERKRFIGAIIAATDDQLDLSAADGVVTLPMAAIQRAKLVLTDRLLAEAAAQQADDAGEDVFSDAHPSG